MKQILKAQRFKWTRNVKSKSVWDNDDGDDDNDYHNVVTCNTFDIKQMMICFLSLKVVF